MTWNARSRAVGGKSYTATMAGSGTGVRLAALLLAWLAGVGAQLHERDLWPLGAYVALAAASVLLLAPSVVRRSFPAAVLGAAVAGFACAGWQASLRLAEVLPPALEGRELTLTGIVATLPQRGPSGLRFTFEVDREARQGANAGVPEQIALGWYKGFHEDASLAAPRGELRAGQRWRFNVRLRQPHGSLNPGGFDYELYLFEQGIRATGYVRDAPPLLLEPAAGHWVERVRQRVRDAIDRAVPDRRTAGVLEALAVGDQGAIEHDDWDLFRNAGVAHLMSISGLHVTMFAWLAGLLTMALWRLSPRAMLRLPEPLAARWGGLFAAAAYALFSGWGVPSQRTVWMLATITLLQSFGVRWPWPVILLAAAAVVTALDPWALTQPGFWLSFMAVALLMSSSFAVGERAAPAAPVPGWRGMPLRLAHHLREDFRTQVIATVGLTPLTLVFFQQVSVVGFAANLLAIPAVTLVITPLALLGIFVAPLWTLGAWIVSGLDAYLGWLASWPGAVWVVPVAPLWAQLSGLFAAALLMLPIPRRARLLALPLALPLLLPPRELPPEGGFDVVAADIGQGMSVLVRTRAHVLVFDAGPQYSAESDAGQRVLVPLLRARGDEHIDRLMLSHRDSDHVGGARSVLGALPVDELWSSLEDGHPLLAMAKKNVRCAAGQRWTWDGVDFVVYRPQRDDYTRKLKSNAMSCVLRVSGGGRSILLGGDIEKEQEALLVAAQGSALRSDVLVAPHHGSRTSSSARFLDAVQPTVGVFQAGYRNRFGHPAADVLARYRERGAAIVASPDCGAWTWLASGAAAGVCEREVHRRYWHYVAAPAPP